MLITRLKQKEEIISLLAGKTAVISCEGCREVYFPADEALEFQEELQRDKIATAVLVCDYICNPDHLMAQTSKSMEIISGADSILVFSCGVGVQTISRNFMDKPVFAACDTIPLPGHQGVTPLEYDCAQCGECFLNDTGGICPITACSKSLVNGQCGGAKNGKCEVDKDKDCGWELIYKRLEEPESPDGPPHPVRLRDFTLS